MDEQPNENAHADEVAAPEVKKPRKAANWLRISAIANIILVVVIAASAGTLVALHQSDTNPNFCATCHLMDSHVTSYLTSNNLDNIHAQSGVQCKDCHDYPLPAEISSGIKYVIGNYEVDENGDLPKRDFGDEICTQCHISLDHVAEKTADLDRNPHDSHNGELACKTCHVAHGEQIDYCSQCHDNGGQQMFGADEVSAE